MQLSKSEYLMFLRHPAFLWLKKHDKSKLPPVDANLQAIFDAGNEFESYAEQLFPDGIRLGFSSYDEYLSLPARTEKVLEARAPFIFQGRFETKELTCICDVIEIVDETTVNLYEIKSGTSVKQENIYDLAFQTHVLELCGLSVNSIHVVHANRSYTRAGDIDIELLCISEDITGDVRDEIPDTIELITQAHEVIAQRSMPTLDLDDDGDINAWLELFLYLHPQKKGSIFDLCWPKNRVAQLYSMGVENLKDIPLDFSLSPKQLLQVNANRHDKVTIDDRSIAEFISGFQFPLYFLDYETLTGVVPPFDGLYPYAQLPFQYSLHVLHSDGTLEHHAYLHKDDKDPTAALSDSLAEHIGTSGTILTWNEKFEKGCNDLMGKKSAAHRKLYKDINKRIADLCIPFQQNWYVHKDFCGSYSIKKVLPVLVPELSYSVLDIGDGASAQRLWTQSVLRSHPDFDKEKICADLEKYCELDTLAMVKIYEVLKDLTADTEVHSESIEKLSLF